MLLQMGSLPFWPGRGEKVPPPPHPDLKWGYPPCQGVQWQNENSTFPRPSDAGGGVINGLFIVSTEVWAVLSNSQNNCRNDHLIENSANV